MKTLTIKKLNTIYSNNGMQKEIEFIFTVSGEIKKHDNIAYNKGSDYQNTSIKASGFSLASGLKAKDFNGQIKEYFENVHSNEFAYVTNDYIAYIMNKEEFKEFLINFSTLTRESTKNGGMAKIRARKESQKMRDWLSERA
jgi:hypothetical protein